MKNCAIIVGLFLIGALLLEARTTTTEPEDKRIQLIYFTASWCGPCQMMKQETWPNPLVQKALENFQFQTVDVDAQKDLAREWSVRSMPTYLLVDPSGRYELGRMSGFMDAYRMATWLDDVHAHAVTSLNEILEAQKELHDNWILVEQLIKPQLSTDELKRSQDALFKLLNNRQVFDEAIAEEIDRQLDVVAETYPQRLLIGILHEDLQVRAYVARALKPQGIEINPWGDRASREAAFQKHQQQTPR